MTYDWRKRRRGGGADTAPLPTVTSVSPSTGLQTGGDVVTITGTGFRSPGRTYTVSYVTFGPTHATAVTVTSDTTLSCTVPAGSVGAADVRVWGTGGLGLLAGGYTYQSSMPTLASISPSTGVSSGGTSVTLTGTAFQGTTSVTLGGTALASFVVVNGTTITGVTAAHVAATVDVVVTNPSGSATLSNGFAYTFTPGDIAGLELWLDSSMGVTQSGTVSSWADQSGTGDANKDAAQATVGLRPAFNASDVDFSGRPTLSFDGSDDYLASGSWASPLAAPYTIYLVTQQTVATDGQIALDYLGANYGWIRARDNSGSGGPNTGLYLYHGLPDGVGAVQNTGVDIWSAPRVVCVEIDGGEAYAYVDDPINPAISRASGHGTDAVNGTTIGAKAGGGSNRWNGKVAAVLIYDGRHDIGDRDNVMGYLRDRFVEAGPAPPPTGPEVFLSGILAYWRGDTVVGSPTPSQITDLSGNGYHLSTVSAVTITASLVADGWTVPNRLLLHFHNSAYARANTTNAFKILHDGTGAAVWTAFFPETYTNQQIFLANNPGSSANTGVDIWWDSTQKRVVVSILNGDGISPVFTLASWKGSVSADAPHTLVINVKSGETEEVQVFLDGLPVSRANFGHKDRDGVGRALSSGNPTSALQVGSLNPSGNSFEGDFAELGIRSSLLDASDRAQVENYLGTRYGVTVATSDTRPLVIFDGNSLVDDAWKAFFEFPAKCIDGAAVEGLNRACYGMRTDEAEARAAVHVDPYIVSAVTEGRTVVYVPWEIINRLADGATKEDAYAEYVTLCQGRRALGALVVAMPMLPLDNPAISEAEFDWINAEIVANWSTFADAISRHDLDATIGPWTARTDLSLFTDGVHLSQTAEGYLWPYVKTAIDSLI